MAQKQYLADLLVDGTLTINTVANAATDTDKFLVLDGTTVKYRTGTQLLADIGPISVPLSSITNATGTNSISNGNFNQTWAWTNLANNGVGFSLTGTSSQLNGYTFSVQMTASNPTPGGGKTAAIYGYATGTNAASSNIGIYGKADANGSDSSFGVYGQGGETGVYGEGSSSGLTGRVIGTTVGGNGVYGFFNVSSGTLSGTYRGLYGQIIISGTATSVLGIGVEGVAGGSTTNYGGYFTAVTALNATKNVGGYFSASSAATTNYAIETGLGSVLIGNLSGAGSRMVVADASGVLSTQAIPAGGVSDGDKGDITVSASGATWTIDSQAVTYAKIQNISTNNRLLGRATAGAGTIEEITLGSGLSFSGTTLNATGFTNPMTTLGDVIYGGASGTPTRLAGNTTTTKQFLTSTGSAGLATAPAWGTISASDIGSGAALTKSDDTNVTLTLGGSPTTALLTATSLTLGWTGQLAVSRGGTGAGTLTGALIGNGTSAVTAVTGTALQYLRRNSGNTAYEFGAIAGSDVTGAALTKADDTNVTLTLGGTPATSLLRAASITVGWTGQLAVGRGGTGASTLTGALIGNGTSAVTAVTGTALQYLRRNSGNTAYEFGAIAGSDVTGAALTKTDDTNVTLTLGGTPATSLLRAASLTLGWTGQLAVSRGGTGASTLTGVVIGNGTSAMTAVAGTGGQLLRRNAGDTAYEFFTPTYLTTNQTITLTGDVGGSGTTSISTTIAAAAVTYAKIQNVAANTFLANATGSAATVQEISTTRIPLFASAITGTPSSTTFLRGDGIWATPAGGSTNARVVQSFTATASQTTFTVTGGYTVDQVDVYYNGSRLNSSEYTASNGSTVVLGTGAPVGTIIDIVKYEAVSAPSNLDSLTDVVISSPSLNQVLQYNGSNWVNATISGGVSDGDKGDITVSASGATWTIDNNVVTVAKLQQIATASFLGRTTAATGDVEVLTSTQATALLNTFTSTLKGLAPASGGGTTNYLRADGTWAAPTVSNVTDGDKGDITVSSGSWAIDANVVTYAKIQQASAGFTIMAKASTGAGNYAELAAGTDSILMRSGSGNLTFGTVVTNQIGNNQVTLGKLATVSTATFLGRVTASTGNVESLTGTQATTLLDTFTTSLKGLVPASGGGTTNFLRADGTWAAPAGGSLTDGDKGDITVSASGATWTIDNAAVTYSKIQLVTPGRILGNSTGSLIGIEEIPIGQFAFFSSDITGTPSSSTYLRGDGTWSTVSAGATTLDDLSDVVITAAATGEYLKFNGTNWVDAVIAAGDLPTGIDATKLADGSVTNTEFQFISTVTSNVQTQLDAKASLTGTETLTNKRINPRVVSTASTATLTPDVSTGDEFDLTAQAAALSIANPTGTPVNGQKIIIRIKDNGTARAITWSGTQYRASTDLAFPTTTIINKTMYIGLIYNSADTKWDMIAYIDNF